MRLCVLLIGILAFSSSVQGKVLIATLAQVKNHVITSREVEIYQEIEKILGANIESLKKEAAETQLIHEWLLYFEASSFYNTSVPQKEVNKEVASVKNRLQGTTRWNFLDVSDKELRSTIERRLEAQRLYDFKKKASVLPVSLPEIETEYTQNRIHYGNQSFEEAKDTIRKNKVESNLQARMAQWFQVLERKYKVQRFSKFNRL